MAAGVVEEVAEGETESTGLKRRRDRGGSASLALAGVKRVIEARGLHRGGGREVSYRVLGKEMPQINGPLSQCLRYHSEVF
jgi:hypothetical protein